MSALLQEQEDDEAQFPFVVHVPYAHAEDKRPFSPPKRGTASAAGYDLTARADGPAYRIPSGGRVLVGTGLHAVIPEGFFGMVCSRSGLALKSGIVVLNAPGIIDADYRGEIGVILMNLGHDNYPLYPGDKIAQLVVLPFAELNFTLRALNSLPGTDRGVGGFGSTGQ